MDPLSKDGGFRPSNRAGGKGGKIVFCEPNTGWNRLPGMGKVCEDLEYQLDGKPITAVPPQCPATNAEPPF